MYTERQPAATAQTVIEITNDGRTVWVNCNTGNIGRFSWNGIDVHRMFTEQAAGMSECLACSHGETHLADWRRFQMLMREHYAVIVDDRHMPKFIRAEVT